jgi:hypothetical protein
MAFSHCESLTVRFGVSLAVTGAKLSLTFGDQEEKKRKERKSWFSKSCLCIAFILHLKKGVQ